MHLAVVAVGALDVLEVLRRQRLERLFRQERRVHQGLRLRFLRRNGRRPLFVEQVAVDFGVEEDFLGEEWVEFAHVVGGVVEGTGGLA